MDNKEKKGKTRKEFIIDTSKGAFGVALGGFMWPKLIFEHSHTRIPKVLTNIVFGSCADQSKSQPIWDAIVDRNPDVFLFLGDNIYGDTEDMSVLKEKYGMLAAKPGYQRLLETCPVLSTWDDHDYGQNDAGSEYPKKVESERIFMDFFSIPEDSPRRKRPGIYGSYIFGPKGKRIQIIMLDTRYFKDTSGRKKNNASAEEKEKQNVVGWYEPSDDTTSTLLGEDQWEWLEEQLKEEADIRIIGSSVQFLAYEKGMESWGNYPHERSRFLDLIKETEANGVIFVSGDVHFSELSRSEEGPYPIYDFTCSGMTHFHEGWSQAVNNFRVGDAYAGYNSGFIRIDWDKEDPIINFMTITETGEIALNHTINKSELTFG